MVRTPVVVVTGEVTVFFFFSGVIARDCLKTGNSPKQITHSAHRVNKERRECCLVYPKMPVSCVNLESDAYLVCLTHALSTEREEVMGLLIGEVSASCHFWTASRPSLRAASTHRDHDCVHG